MSRKIKSTIYRNDIVENKEATRLASDEYFHVYVENDMGELIPALFTETELNKGVDRAEKNPEDIVEHDCGCWGFGIWAIIGTTLGAITLVLLKIHNLM